MAKKKAAVRSNNNSPSKSSPSKAVGAVEEFPKEPTRRVASGSLIQLKPEEIRALKETFTLLDKDADGFIGKEDLRDMLISLGNNDPADECLENMLDQFPQSVSFSAYFSSMSTKLSEFSANQELLDAFKSFDDDNTGTIDPSELEPMLIENGMSKQEIDSAMSSFSGVNGYKYKDFVNILRAQS